MFRWVLLLLAPLMGGLARADEGRQLKRVDRAVIENAIPLPPVSLRDEGGKQTIKIPAIYAGKPTALKAKLLNETSSAISIDRLVSSCGCTSGILATTDVDRGESTELLLLVNQTRPGTFGSSVRLHTEWGWHKLEVVGEVEPLVSLSTKSVAITRDMNSIDFGVNLHLPDVKPEDVTVKVDGVEIQPIKPLRYRTVVDPTIAVNRLGVAVFAKGERLTTDVIHVVQESIFAVRPHSVIVSGDRATVFVEAGVGPDAEVSLFIDGIEVAPIINSMPMGSITRVQFQAAHLATLTEGEHRAEVQIDGRTGSFVIRRL